MNRRGFLGLLGAVTMTAAVGIDLTELLLPESKTIFLPPSGGWVTRPGNSLLTINYITRQALEILEHDLVVADRISRTYAMEEANSLIESWSNVRMPPRYRGLFA